MENFCHVVLLAILVICENGEQKCLIIMQEWANEFEGEINGEGVGGSVKHNFVTYIVL